MQAVLWSDSNAIVNPVLGNDKSSHQQAEQAWQVERTATACLLAHLTLVFCSNVVTWWLTVNLCCDAAKCAARKSFIFRKKETKHFSFLF